VSQAYERYETIFEQVEAPFAFVDLDAMWANADEMLGRAAGKPIRVATKSVRCRTLVDRILDRSDGFSGLLTFTLPETVWLAKLDYADLLLAYPTTDLAALGQLELITASDPERAPVVMVDSVAHLELIESVLGKGAVPIRVCLELDTSWWTMGGRLKVGPKRSPIRTPEQAVSMARGIEERPGVTLVGLMAYEGHIAGVGDRVPGSPLRSLAIRQMQRRSARELRERRAAVVEAVSKVTELRFVNGGGTGSLHTTAAEDAVTELAAGSGFYAPALFDNYRAFSLRPAAMFALPIVRKPGSGVATALGGGYLASGAGGPDRLPVPHLPAGLRFDPQEGAGEVQTPLLGKAADDLAIADRVYFRHVKAGELCERFASLYLVEEGRIVDEVPTYRGEGETFL
jgi:D-serine deaminase-like pyridoxal phosphate-dependent protein